MSNYSGSRLLACFGTFQGCGGLSPENGFFDACRTLMKQGDLGGIFVWCADSSKEKDNRFKDEIEAQELLANSQPQQMSVSSMSAALSSDRGLFVDCIDAQRSSIRLSSADSINPAVDFHFILACAIDADKITLRPTNGCFDIFWQNNRLFPKWIETIKQKHINVKFAASLGNNTVGPKPANFNPYTSYSWVNNAIKSLTGIIREYNLDGIDINYQHFSENVHHEMFADCIGQVITNLKSNRVVSFVSIAPSENDTVQKYYHALWEKHESVIDYINFQFYDDDSWNIGQFIESFKSQKTKYQGGRILASFNTEKNFDAFFDGCKILKSDGILGGISFWSEDPSSRAKNSFDHNKRRAVELLASTAH